MRQMSERPENVSGINKFCKRLVESKTNTQQMNVIATGGVQNQAILKVQSRKTGAKIAKSSNKNRFPDSKKKVTGAKKRNIGLAIKDGVRNKGTQSKK